MHGGLHHLHSRKRVYKNLEKYPHPSLFKRFFDKLMYGVAFATPLALLPQAVDVFVTKSVESLFLPTWAALAVVNVLWIVYGVIHRETPIIISHVLLVSVHAAILTGILLFR